SRSGTSASRTTRSPGRPASTEAASSGSIPSNCAGTAEIPDETVPAVNRPPAPSYRPTSGGGQRRQDDRDHAPHPILVEHRADLRRQPHTAVEPHQQLGH